MSFSAYIENTFISLSPEGVTEIFLISITAIVAIVIFLSLIKKGAAFTGYAPTLVTSLGILGTFVGIVIGLLEFDTGNIDKSIPDLLAGLKTAFLTSIYGLIAAVLINIFQAIIFIPLAKRSGKAVVADVSPKDIYKVLETQNDLTMKLHHALAGNEEGSLVGQIKMMRSDMSDLSRIKNSLDVKQEDSLAYQLIAHNVSMKQGFHDFQAGLFERLENFADMLSKSATEQIIEALRNVIQDFNKNITEQFGENFKALDESVKKLVTWQEQYRLQVELMGEQYQQSVTSLVGTREAVAGIWKECELIPSTMNDLKNVLEVNQHQIMELQRHLESFVQMRDAAIEAVPTINEKINEIGNQLSQSTKELQEHLTNVSQDLNTGANEMRVSLKEGAEQFRDSVTTTQGSFNELSHILKQSSEEMSATLKDTSSELTEKTSQLLENIGKSSESMQQQAQNTINEMSQGTQRVIQDMQTISQGVEESKQQLLNEVTEHNKSVAVELSNLLNQSQEVFNNHVQDLSTEMAQGTQTVIREMQTLSNGVEESKQRLLNDVSTHTESVANELLRLLSRAQDTFSNHVQEMSSDLARGFNSQVSEIEKATARQIQTAMQEMGQSLVQITARFISDYQQMVNAMDRVIAMQRNR